MGVLRIGYQGRESKFAYNGIKKNDIPEQVMMHLTHWGKEQLDPKRPETARPLPIEGYILEWQDGDSWDPNAPAERIPLPPIKVR